MYSRFVAIVCVSLLLAGSPHATAATTVVSSSQSATIQLVWHDYVDGGIWRGLTKEVWFHRGWYLLTFDPKSGGTQPLARIQERTNLLASLAYNEGDVTQEYWQIFQVRRSANLKLSAVAARANVYAIHVTWLPSGGHPTGN